MPKVKEFLSSDNIDTFGTSGFWYISGSNLTGWTTATNGTLPSITANAKLGGTLLVIGKAVDYSVKQIFIYNNEVYIRTGTSIKTTSTNTWTSWDKLITKTGVQSEISTFATALAGAINPSS